MESYLLNSESICSNTRQIDKAFAKQEKGAKLVTEQCKKKKKEKNESYSFIDVKDKGTSFLPFSLISTP